MVLFHQVSWAPDVHMADLLNVLQKSIQVHEINNIGQNSGGCLASLIMPSCQSLNFTCLCCYLVIIASCLSVVHRDRKVCLMLCSPFIV